MRQVLTMYSLILWLPWITVHAQSLVPTQQAGKWGLKDSTGKTLIRFEQDRVSYLTDGIYAYWQDDKVKLYGNRLKRKEFRDAALLKGTTQTLVLADRKGLYGLVTSEGKKVLPFRFCAPPKALGKHILLPVRDGRQINFGLYTLKGENIIPPKYYLIKEWGRDYYKCKTQTGGEALFSLKGELIFKSEEKEIDWVVDDFIVLGSEETKEVFLKNSEQVFTLKNLEYRSGMMVGYNEKEVFCILTPRGKLMALKKNQELRNILNGRILICELDKNKQCKKERLLDADMKTLIPSKFDRIHTWQGNLAVVQPDRTKEIYSLYQIDSNPKILLKDKPRIDLYDHGWLRVYDEGEWQFLDRNLQSPKLSYEDAAKLPETYVAISLRNLRRLREQNSAYFDSDIHSQINPKLIFPLEANEAKSLRDKYNNEPLPNRLVVRTPWQNPGPRNLLTDLYGKVISEFHYTGISYYEAGLIIVYGKDTIDGVIKSVMGLIDMDGNLQIPLVYDKIEKVSSEHIVVQKYGLYGVISRENEIIFPIKYQYVRPASGYFFLKRFGKWGIADQTRKIIIPLEYDEIKFLDGQIGFEAKKGKEVILLDKKGGEVGKK